VRVEIMGSQKCGIAGKSQSAVVMINPIISSHTRMHAVLCDDEDDGDDALRRLMSATAHPP
jgi:hypothetical protein